MASDKILATQHNKFPSKITLGIQNDVALNSSSDQLNLEFKGTSDNITIKKTGEIIGVKTDPNTNSSVATVEYLNDLATPVMETLNTTVNNVADISTKVNSIETEISETLTNKIDTITGDSYLNVVVNSNSATISHNTVTLSTEEGNDPQPIELEFGTTTTLIPSFISAVDGAGHASVKSSLSISMPAEKTVEAIANVLENPVPENITITKDNKSTTIVDGSGFKKNSDGQITPITKTLTIEFPDELKVGNEVDSERTDGKYIATIGIENGKIVPRTKDLPVQRIGTSNDTEDSSIRFVSSLSINKDGEIIPTTKEVEFPVTGIDTNKTDGSGTTFISGLELGTDGKIIPTTKEVEFPVTGIDSAQASQTTTTTFLSGLELKDGKIVPITSTVTVPEEISIPDVKVENGTGTGISAHKFNIVSDIEVDGTDKHKLIKKTAQIDLSSYVNPEIKDISVTENNDQNGISGSAQFNIIDKIETTETQNQLKVTTKPVNLKVSVASEDKGTKDLDFGDSITLVSDVISSSNNLEIKRELRTITLPKLETPVANTQYDSGNIQQLSPNQQLTLVTNISKSGTGITFEKTKYQLPGTPKDTQNTVGANLISSGTPAHLIVTNTINPNSGASVSNSVQSITVKETSVDDVRTAELTVIGSVSTNDLHADTITAGSLNILGDISKTNISDISTDQYYIELAANRGNSGLIYPAGIYVNNYDGNGKSGGLFYGNDGFAKVGDISINESSQNQNDIFKFENLQILLTRANEIADTAILAFDNNNKTAVASGHFVSDITDLKSGLNTAQTDITNLQGNVTTAETNINTINTTLGEAQTNIENLQTNVTAIEGQLENFAQADDLTNLQTNVTSIEGQLENFAQADDLTNLQTNVTAIEGQLENFAQADDLTNLQTNVKTAETNITNLQGSVTTIEGQLSSFAKATDLTNLQTKVGTAEINIGNLQTNVKTAETNITNLQGKVGTAETNITNLQTNVTSIEGQLSSFAKATDLDTVKGSLSAAQTDISNLAKRDTTITKGTPYSEELSHSGTFEVITGITKEDGAHKLKLETTTFTLPPEPVLNIKTSDSNAGPKEITKSKNTIEAVESVDITSATSSISRVKNTIFFPETTISINQEKEDTANLLSNRTLNGFLVSDIIAGDPGTDGENGGLSYDLKLKGSNVNIEIPNKLNFVGYDNSATKQTKSYDGSNDIQIVFNGIAAVDPDTSKITATNYTLNLGKISVQPNNNWVAGTAEGKSLDWSKDGISVLGVVNNDNKFNLYKLNLPASIARMDESNTFTVSQTFSGGLSVASGKTVTIPTITATNEDSAFSISTNGRKFYVAEGDNKIIIDKNSNNNYIFKGNADTATTLATERTFSLTGDVSGSAKFNGSADCTISVAVSDDSHNHIIANIDNLQTTLDAKEAKSNLKALAYKDSLGKSDVGLGNVTNDAQVKRTEMGVANGVATLDANGLVPSSQLPSYVDDVIEGTYSANATTPAGVTGKIYVDTSTNKTFRWSGSKYVEISASLALGETSSTAYAGDKGKANADAIAGLKDGSIEAGKAKVAPWSGLTGVPSTFTPSTHSHTKSEITDFPTTLKNPTALTFNNGGSGAGSGTTYDGSTARTISYNTIGAAPTSHASNATTYGTGTTSNYGHVKLVGGDMKNGTYTAGVAVAANHTHSQYLTSYTDTKNTAGSTNTASKIFLIGATSQAENPQTYSHSGVYATNGALVAGSFSTGGTISATGNVTTSGKYNFGTSASMEFDSTYQAIKFVFA